MKKPVSFPVVVLFAAAVTSAYGQVALNGVPARELGQLNLTQGNVNLVEGREFNSPRGIAIDASSTPPALYVADTFNHRVLGFRDATNFKNGQKADIVIGQIDFLSTAQQGPSGTRSTGLSFPFALAVDAKGSLYVLDGGNNRIMRFPAPFSQSIQTPDFVIGQNSFSTNGANTGGVSASTLAFNSGGSVAQAYLTFDQSGNLWVADALNNRVLRFNGALLNATNPTNGPAADLVLGQVDFGTNSFVNPTNDPAQLTAIQEPTGIAFDKEGRLFVSESVNGARGRILIYNPPFANGKTASRLIGVVPATVNPQPPSISEQQLGASSGGLFTLSDGVAIADTSNNRLLLYKPVDQFTPNLQTQQAISLVGQDNFSVNPVNRGQPETGPDRLAGPQAAVATATELFVVDSGNNRVIVMPYSGTTVRPATRVLGQDQFNLNAPNLVEGREFRFIASSGSGLTGIVTDWTSNPPHLYVSDAFNNRVLGYKDLRGVKAGDRADIVIGQPDFARTLINYPSNDPLKPTASGLFRPAGLTLDKAGNLYVADSGNGRVLRFPAPFDNPQTLPSANLVIGQRGFNGPTITDATAANLAFPVGLAFASDNGLLVSDLQQNRVLFFAGKSTELTNGMAANRVIGQPDFSSIAGSSADNRFNGPFLIATDVDDRLYVADAGNNRISIFNRAPSVGPDPHAGTLLLGLSAPQGVSINPNTLEIWVANTGNNQMLRYPSFNDLAVTGPVPNFGLTDVQPLALTQDLYGNLYTADKANRVIINYPGLLTVNGASFVQGRPLAPGAVGSIFGFPNQFGTTTQVFAGFPLPLQLGNVQVLINNAPVPLFYVGTNQINFLVPMSAPTTGTVDLLVQRVDTGQILGNFPLAISDVSPALFTTVGGGNGQVAAINQDGTINGPDHPAPNGSIVAFYGTGQGVVANAPPDGTPAPGPLPTPYTPTVIIGDNQVNNPVPASYVKYSGLAPGLVGVWQVNVLIPDEVAPTKDHPNTPVVFVVNTVPSNGFSNARLTTTMWVKQKP